MKEQRAADSVEAVFREDRSRLLALLAARFGDLDLAEEVISEAIEVALERWPVDGVPGRPLAWLLTTARRKALDRIRRDRTYAARLAELQVESDRAAAAPAESGFDDIPDERLRLFFTCCHPALSLESQTGLMLRRRPPPTGPPSTSSATGRSARRSSEGWTNSPVGDGPPSRAYRRASHRSVGSA
ncbi:sigma factor [Actinoallomurus soli]|uniref:sigma factor n=1 Tax=Actinoallomurus soli TaxID=2952535 RepID=UPI0020939956|nr:sigma factor [Actinoallomurus soli]MCO5974643.1 hypothetical protein [Actinoallomurus soli]